MKRLGVFFAFLLAAFGAPAPANAGEGNIATIVLAGPATAFVNQTVNLTATYTRFSAAGADALRINDTDTNATAGAAQNATGLNGVLTYPVNVGAVGTRHYQTFNQSLGGTQGNVIAFVVSLNPQTVTWATDAATQASADEHIQGLIDRGKRQGRMVLPERLVELLRSGMGVILFEGG